MVVAALLWLSMPLEVRSRRGEPAARLAVPLVAQVRSSRVVRHRPSRTLRFRAPGIWRTRGLSVARYCVQGQHSGAASFLPGGKHRRSCPVVVFTTQALPVLNCGATWYAHSE